VVIQGLVDCLWILGAIWPTLCWKRR